MIAVSAFLKRYFKFFIWLLAIGIIFYVCTQTFILTDVLLRLRNKRTVSACLEEYGPIVRQRLITDFVAGGVFFPPTKLILIAFKDRKVLEVWAADKKGKFSFIREYPILAMSGYPGPKLQEGDMQVPEGIYRVSYLNPNSMFHLSLKLNYPNFFDKRMARLDGRENLGGDIMIHGGAQSIGCIAIGDEAIEDVFVLVAEAGLRNAKVIISPTDFRENETAEMGLEALGWMSNLYTRIKGNLVLLKKP